mgnify:CR=1 FL=1
MLKDAIDLSTLHRVLVVKLRHLGDVLLTSPAFTVLKNHAPHLEIDALVYRDTEAMLSGHPAIANVFTIDRGWKQEDWTAQMAHEWRLLRSLRARHYDLIVHLTENSRGAVLSLLLKPHYSVARDYPAKRGRLWRKGETSGHILRLVGLALDCDADALLVTARPTGPTCHRGTRSCFDAAGAPAAGQGFAWLEALWSTIEERARQRPAGSYTASLLNRGVDAIARKVTEEAVEVLMAARDDAGAAVGERPATRTALAGEAADLLYHTLVLLAERNLPPALVIETLRARHAGQPARRTNRSDGDESSGLSPDDDRS